MEEGILTPPDILKFAEYPDSMKTIRDSALAEDPVLSEAYSIQEKELERELNRTATDKFLQLVSQLQSLNLKTADKEKLEQLIKNIKGETENETR
jgi:hypothetical protein